MIYHNKNKATNMYRLWMSSMISLLFLATTATAQTVPYGDNPEAGKYIMLNGARHYYEVYGKGAPLLLIHGNSTATKGWKSQIEYFSGKYQVFAIDCRGRGKSELGPDTLTYMQQAKDMTAFIKALSLDSVMVIGKSDGGIIALLMGIYYPEHLKKIVAFSANLWPDSTALYPQVLDEQQKDRLHAEAKLAQGDTSRNWRLERERLRMMAFQPHITAADLNKITLPVLVMSCDRDVIREEHTFFIYQHIRRANLCIVPGERHGIARENPALFNLLVDKYLSEPFKDFSTRF
jgi:pimeloyl-ACP methyl ester carboxylesterase